MHPAPHCTFGLTADSFACFSFSPVFAATVLSLMQTKTNDEPRIRRSDGAQAPWPCIEAHRRQVCICGIRSFAISSVRIHLGNLLCLCLIITGSDKVLGDLNEEDAETQMASLKQRLRRLTQTAQLTEQRYGQVKDIATTYEEENRTLSKQVCCRAYLFAVSATFCLMHLCYHSCKSLRSD